MWYLRQTEHENEETFIFSDEGSFRDLTPSQCRNRERIRLAFETQKGQLVDISSIRLFEAPFMGTLEERWARIKGEYEGHDELCVRTNEVEFLQYEAFIRYEYIYQGRTYVAWIDRATGEVFETRDQGLMEAQAKSFAIEGDKVAWWSPQGAVYHYEKACTLVPDSAYHVQELRKQYHFALWLFRLSAVGVGGWLWSLFLGEYGADPTAGWYIAAALLVADFLFSLKRFWVSLLGTLPVAGVIFLLLPYFYSPQMATSQEIQLYTIYSILGSITASLLFAHDLLFRVRGGLLVFPLFGAIIAGATAPTMYLEFSEDPQQTLLIIQYVLYVMGGLSIIRFWKRHWIKACDTLAYRVNFRLARLETCLLKPRLLTLVFWLCVFSSMAYVWYVLAGPGVPIERKFQAAKRLLTDEVLFKRGQRLLLSCVRSDYAPAMSLYAEALIKGGSHFPKDIQKGYKMAIAAGDRGDAYAWRLQGYCYEHGVGVQQNMHKACICYGRAAELGDKDAAKTRDRLVKIAKVWERAHEGDGESAYTLALYYMKGEGVEKDVGLARIWLLRAAEANDVRAQLLVSEWLIKGIGGNVNVGRGIEYCQKAAQRGDKKALENLANYYFDGRFVDQDYVKAVGYFEQLYKQGSEHAAYVLGICYQMGKGVECDNDKAYQYFQFAAQNKVMPAMFSLGEYFRNGLVVPMNYTKAYEFYLEASSSKWEDPVTGRTHEDAKVFVERTRIPAKYWELAINEGDAEAQYQLAMCYKSGKTGLSKDMYAAFKLFKQAAEQGHPEALYQLALCYSEGNGGPQSDVKMLETLSAAAKKGHPQALFLLGDLYQTGRTVEVNYTVAYCYFKQAFDAYVEGADARMKAIEILAEYWDKAHKGNADAQRNLAICYRDGIQITANPKIAKVWFEKAANQSNIEAQYELAILKKQLNESPKEIVLWLEKAVIGNHTKAKTMLAEYLYEGEGVSSDYKRALRLWEDAVKQNDARAAYWLGRHYYQGRGFFGLVGLGKDRDKAKHFLKLAYAAKDKDATLLLGKLYEDEGERELANECYCSAAGMSDTSVGTLK